MALKRNNEKEREREAQKIEKKGGIPKSYKVTRFYEFRRHQLLVLPKNLYTPMATDTFLLVDVDPWIMESGGNHDMNSKWFQGKNIYIYIYMIE